MAIFECVGGISPTGNATPGDVKEGVTFSNENDVDQVGTFAAQEKTIESSRANQVVTPDEGKYLSKVNVTGLKPAGTFTPTSRAANIDMGADSNYRYVTTESVPNNNSGTYTFPSGDTGGTKDLGVTNTYRYVNAGNVYNKGYQAGKADGDIRHNVSVSVTPIRHSSSKNAQAYVEIKVDNTNYYLEYTSQINDGWGDPKVWNFTV